MTARPETRRPAAAHHRLGQLFEISKVLTRFESVERTVPEILALMATTLPDACLILVLAGSPQPLVVWHAEGFDQDRLFTLRARAYAAYSYLATAETHKPIVLAETSQLAITLPLAVARRKLLGVIALSSPAKPSESDLNFVNTVANQLAIALDRHAIEQAKQRVTEEGRALAEALVTERTRELREANEELRRTDRYKDEFLSVLSHELRTPLNFIVGFASILGDGDHGTLNEAQHRDVEHILAGADRLGRLVDNLLDMAKIAAGRLRVYPQEELVGPLVDEALYIMRGLADERGIELAADIRLAEPFILDRQAILRVFTYLLENALRFTSRGGAVTLRAELRDGSLRAEVEDTGTGIPPEDVPRLFKQFKQLDMRSTREVGGTGLGLSIAKGIVDAHGGEIGVRSKPGEGSTFWFSLPARPPAG